MTKPKHDPDHRSRSRQRQQSRGRARAQGPAAAPAEGALASLAALGAALNGVDTASVTGRSGMPMMEFKSREGGIWMFGQRRTVPEDGSRWAVNPLTFKRGYICFSNDNKVVGEHLASRQPADARTHGAARQRASNGRSSGPSTSSASTGPTPAPRRSIKTTTVGGIQAIVGLIDAVRDRLNGGQHGGKVSPVVHLEKDFYPHSEHGKIWTPLLTIVDWMPLSGPAPAPTPAPPPPAEQPRRRRVG